MTEHWIILDLNPEPWAVGPLGTKRVNRGVIPYMGQNAQLNAYKEAVAEQARAALGEDSVLFSGKCKLTIYFWRQRAEYKTPQARTHRKHEADATNMLKATEDALQGIFYKNDKDNADVRSVIVEQGEDVTPRIVIHVESYYGFNPDELPSWVWATLDASQSALEFQ